METWAREGGAQAQPGKLGGCRALIQMEQCSLFELVFEANRFKTVSEQGNKDDKTLLLNVRKHWRSNQQQLVRKFDSKPVRYN